jgi:hypothetical protein
MRWSFSYITIGVAIGAALILLELVETRQLLLGPGSRMFFEQLLFALEFNHFMNVA